MLFRSDCSPLKLSDGTNDIIENWSQIGFTKYEKIWENDLTNRFLRRVIISVKVNGLCNQTANPKPLIFTLNSQNPQSNSKCTEQLHESLLKFAVTGAPQVRQSE